MPGRPRNCRQVGDVRAARGEPGGGQDPPDGSRADAVPEAEESAQARPRRHPGLPRPAPDQLADLLRDQRASGGGTGTVLSLLPFARRKTRLPDRSVIITSGISRFTMSETLAPV